PPTPARPRVYVAPGADKREAARLRTQGYATLAASSLTVEPEIEARRLGCTHVLRGTVCTALS
ncbi:ATP phosphoribosyltransferase regulatory subunit, partial [Acetobacter sp. DmW_125123]